jgi:hypothetical protein
MLDGIPMSQERVASMHGFAPGRQTEKKEGACWLGGDGVG